jgi:hypothetical protein
MGPKRPPVEPRHDNLTHDKSNCEHCRNRQEFELPDHLLDQVLKRDAVIFAGAGVSTESRMVFPWTLYDEIPRSRVGVRRQTAFPKAYEPLLRTTRRPTIPP